MIVATKMSMVDVIKSLLSIKHIVRSVAFSWACEHGHLDLVKILIENYRVYPAVNDDLGMYFAAVNNRPSVVEFLLTDPKVNPGAQEIEVTSGWDFKIV